MLKWTAQQITEKLDRNIMSLSEAKAFLQKTERIEIKARTKDKFIKELWKIANNS